VAKKLANQQADSQNFVCALKALDSTQKFSEPNLS